ncbi:hypothetical protein EI94DRAFT_1803685 [Lactarius quietus]|nr:hypothetical protein EI94DRAFT_1803685 [Lactarius quietus]
MRDHRPTYSEIASAISSVSRDLEEDRFSRGFWNWKNLTRGQIRRGEQYMDGSHIIIQLSHPLLNKGDKAIVRNTVQDATDARKKLDAVGIGKIQKFRGAREYKRLCKETFEVVTGTSRRALNDSLLETSDGIYPPAGASPASPKEPDRTRPSGMTGSVTPTHENQAGTPSMTPREPDRTDLLARESPATPEESGASDPPGTPPTPEGSGETDAPAGALPHTPEGSDSPLPYDRRSTFLHPAATSSIAEWAQKVETTPSSEAADIAGPVDDSFSFIYDSSMATSGTTIASYKTEKTVISTKSRYNTRPRHKYADHGYLRPQGFASLAVDRASIAETELSDEHDEPPSSPPPTPTVSPKLESALESTPGPSQGTLPPDGPAPESRHTRGRGGRVVQR